MKLIYNSKPSDSILTFKILICESCDNKEDTVIGLNKESLFLDAMNLGKKLQNIDRDFAIDLQKVSNRFKFLIIQMIAKYIYKFDRYKTTKKKEQKIILKDSEEHKDIINEIIAQVQTCNFVRDLQNIPANLMTPEMFCKYVKKELSVRKGKGWGLSIKIMDDTDLLKKGLHLIHEMGKASVHKSRFLIMHYKHDNAKKTICIVGKGVTFDAGGLNIKTDEYMSLEMKSDKSGGCIAVGLMKYLISHEISDCNLVVLVPLIENMVDGDVIHPGDIVKAYNGKTVEIVNTDAEGRLIMADALAYAEEYDIDYIFDIATLTGWTDRLHCHHSASYFTKNKYLFDLTQKIGEFLGERVIGLPMWTEYTTYTTSQVADYKNYGFECSKAGGFMAAMFLYNFVPKKLQDKWIHFDISNNFTGSFSNGNSFLLVLNLILHLAKS